MTARSSLFSYLLHNPINNPIHHTRRRAVHNHGACNLEHVRAETEHPALTLMLHSRRHNRVGKACYRYHCARTAVLCDFVKYTYARQHGGYTDEDEKYKCFDFLTVHCCFAEKLSDDLREGTDYAAYCKGFDAVF